MAEARGESERFGREKKALQKLPPCSVQIRESREENGVKRGNDDGSNIPRWSVLLKKANQVEVPGHQSDATMRCGEESRAMTRKKCDVGGVGICFCGRKVWGLPLAGERVAMIGSAVGWMSKITLISALGSKCWLYR